MTAMGLKRQSLERKVLALLQEKGELYGVPIHLALEEHIHRPVSIGDVYSVLLGLEAEGKVTSRLGDPTPQRGGRPKRYFSITSRGQQHLN